MSLEKKKMMNSGISAVTSKNYSRYAKQFLLPIECDGAPLVSPSQYSSQVCARHLHKVFDISSATPAYANGFTIMMNPDLYNPGFVSSSAAIVTPVGGASVVSATGAISPVKATTNAFGYLNTVTASGESNFLYLEDKTDSGASTRKGIGLTPGPASTLVLSLTNDSKFPTVVSFCRKVAAGAWSVTTIPLAPRQEYSISIGLGLNTDAVAFSFPADADPSTSVWVAMSFSSNQLLGDAVRSFSPAFERFIIDSEVSSGRVISMSVLCTNTSPEIANGGNINAGRVPRSFNPSSQIASQMASLPENRRYQGPASQGAYVSWMPSQFDEYEVDTVSRKHEALASAEYLIVEVSGWNPPAGTTASFRIQFDWIVEFYTPNQLFEKSICPPFTPEFADLYHVLLSLDAATCNPGHLDLLKKILREGVSLSQKGLQFYGNNKEVINGILKGLALMLA